MPIRTSKSTIANGEALGAIAAGRHMPFWRRDQAVQQTTRCSVARQAAPLVCPAQTDAVDLTPLLLKPGDVCTAFGVVVAVNGQVTFGPAGASAAIAPRRKPSPKDGAIPVTGIDLTNLMFRYEIDGAVGGQATITVVWRDGTLEVVDQHAERPAFAQRMVRTLPGPPPAGGWRAVDGLHLATPLVDELKGAGLLVAITMADVSDSAKIPVITATDRDEVIRRLGPTLGAGVRVVQSRYPAGRITEMVEQVRQHWDSWGCYLAGERTDSHFQVTVTVRVARVLPQLVEWMADVPDDLVRIMTWLDPTRRGPPVLEL